MSLNPTITASLVSLYQQNIDSLIDNLGKEVEIHFPKLLDATEPEFYDPIRDTFIKPAFKSDSVETVTPDITKIIKAITMINPQEFLSFGNIKVQESQAIIKLTTYIVEVPDLIRCSYVIPNLDVEGYINMRFRLVRSPVPKGLKSNHYAISYWAAI